MALRILLIYWVVSLVLILLSKKDGINGFAWMWKELRKEHDEWVTFLAMFTLMPLVAIPCSVVSALDSKLK